MDAALSGFWTSKDEGEKEGLANVVPLTASVNHIIEYWKAFFALTVEQRPKNIISNTPRVILQPEERPETPTTVAGPSGHRQEVEKSDRDTIPLTMATNQNQRDGEAQTRTSKKTTAPVPAQAPPPPYSTKNSTILGQSGPGPSHSVSGRIESQTESWPVNNHPNRTFSTDYGMFSPRDWNSSSPADSPFPSGVELEAGENHSLTHSLVASVAD